LENFSELVQANTGLPFKPVVVFVVGPGFRNPRSMNDSPSFVEKATSTELCETATKFGCLDCWRWFWRASDFME
jgi:hypothetical protein